MPHLEIRDDFVHECMEKKGLTVFHGAAAEMNPFNFLCSASATESIDNP